LNARAKHRRKEQAKPQVRPPFKESPTYYSADDIAAVLATFQPRPDLDRAHFALRIEIEAMRLVQSAAAERNNTADAPSVRERYWRRLGARVSGVVGELRALDRNHQKDLIWAGQDLAQADRGLPDFEGEPGISPAEGNAPADVGASVWRIWPAEQQIDKALDELQWLARCVQWVIKRAEGEKTHPGRQPDEPLHLFVYHAIELLEEASDVQVRMPGTDRKTYERQGIMLDFLDAALQPLRPGDQRPREARYEELYGLIRRSLPHPLFTE
jgi:hypothetical protein